MNETATENETRTRYTFGYGRTTPPTHEVLQVLETADGKILSADIILTVTSRAKAEAIAMILNAPENH